MKNWSLNAKIGLILGIFVVGSVGISAVALYELMGINKIVHEITEVLIKRDQLTNEVQGHQRNYAIYNRDFIIENDPKRMEVIYERMRVSREEMIKSLDQFDEVASPEALVVSKEYRTTLEKWIKVNAKTRDLARAGKDRELQALIDTDEAPLINEIKDEIRRLNEITSAGLEAGTLRADEIYKESQILLLTISIGVILFCLILSFFIMRAVTKAIDQVISNLDDNSNQVTSAAQQIASASEQLSQAATEQASSLEETAASIEEMNSMVQKNSENANKSSDVSDVSKKSATRGKSVVEDMIRAIEDINDSNKEISEIVKVIGEIGNKTKVINDIVFQTKLLSFNASVEAARAGEHGKGFAVVAEEVGNLAQMSGNAAKEISALLEGSIQKVERIVSETKQKVESSTEVAQQCGTVLEEIVGNVSSVSQMVGEIAVACQEQAQGVQEITKAMNQLDQVTQENASTSEEAASSAEELSAQAESLRGVVKVLVSTIKGAKGQDVVSNGSNSHYSSLPTKAKKSDTKVLHFKNEHTKSKAPSSSDYQVVSGGDTIPSENDPRFKEI